MTGSIKTYTDTGQEIDVYVSAVPLLFDEYVSHHLEDPDLIKKSAVFAGAMRFIFEHLFRPEKPQINNKHTKLDLSDIDGLDKVWGAYCNLCYTNGIRPTLLRFCVMTGLSMDTLHCWKTGYSRGATPRHSETVKKWLRECESSIYDGVLDNQVGAIFAAKADFAWRETSPSLPEAEQQYQIDSVEAIRARHADAALTMPEKPDFD